MRLLSDSVRWVSTKKTDTHRENAENDIQTKNCACVHMWNAHFGVNTVGKRVHCCCVFMTLHNLQQQTQTHYFITSKP